MKSIQIQIQIQFKFIGIASVKHILNIKYRKHEDPFFLLAKNKEHIFETI